MENNRHVANTRYKYPGSSQPRALTSKSLVHVIKNFKSMKRHSFFPFRLYNHVQKASKLPSGCDYSLFKVGGRI